MKTNKNVVKFKKRKTINIGVVVFIVLFIYIAIQVFIFVTKEKMAIYEVKIGANVEDDVVTSLIMRDEEVILSEDAGYISYLFKDGARIRKKASIYSIDDNRLIYDMIREGEEPIKIPKESINEIQKEVNDFNANYTDNDFNLVYEFKENLENTASTILNDAMLTNAQEIARRTGISSNYKTIYSEKSGLVSYHLDSYEGIKIEDINMDLFNLQEYKLKNMKTNEVSVMNDPVYKIIKSDQWSLVFPLNSGQVEKIGERESMDITLMDKNLNYRGGFSVIQKGGEYYGKINLDKYMALYVKERFVDIKLSLNSTEGLKIPTSSIVEKEFNLIPLDSFITGGNSLEKGVVKELYNELGEVEFLFTPCKIYYQNDKYAYVDNETIPVGTWIFNEETNGRYQVLESQVLVGVYNINKGYSIFRRIEPLYENDEYSIIKKDSPYGLSLYDHIALNGEKVKEDEIIY